MNWQYTDEGCYLNPWDIPIGSCFIPEDEKVFLHLTNWGDEGTNRCFRLSPEPKFMILRVNGSDISDFAVIPKGKLIRVDIQWRPR